VIFSFFSIFSNFIQGVTKMPMPAKSARLFAIDGNAAHKTKKELNKRIEAEEKMKIHSDNIHAPTWLSKTAQKEFNRLAALLVEVEIMTEADINHLALYCDAYDKYICYDRQIKRTGYWIAGKNEDKPNPFINKKSQAAAQMRAFATDLGLSPAARAKLAIRNTDSKPGDDEDEDF
jgi:P27 family predicted phage terminase small subunit